MTAGGRPIELRLEAFVVDVGDGAPTEIERGRVRGAVSVGRLPTIGAAALVRARPPLGGEPARPKSATGWREACSARSLGGSGET